MEKKQKAVKVPCDTCSKENIIEEYKIENTIIQICDDYCKDKNKEDIDKILKRCKEIAYKYILK